MQGTFVFHHKNFCLKFETGNRFVENLKHVFLYLLTKGVLFKIKNIVLVPKSIF